MACTWAFWLLKVKVPFIGLATQCVSLRSEGRYFVLMDMKLPIGVTCGF
jgi:hypothetical protein